MTNQPPTLAETLFARLVKIEGLLAVVLAWWSVSALADNTIATSPSFAVLATSGGELWLWGGLALGLIQMAAVLSDWFPLRLITMLTSVALYGAISIAIIRVSPTRPALAFFGPYAIFSALAFGNRWLSDERRRGRHAE